MRVIEVFRALKDGKLAQIGLSAEQVRRLCPESSGPGWVVESEAMPVAEATGVVHTWPSGRDHVHWQCPLCGRLHISDRDAHDDSNPALWFCESSNGGMCLVHWERSPA